MSIEDIAPHLFELCERDQTKPATKTQSRGFGRRVLSVWNRGLNLTRDLTYNPDPLVQASNWVAFIIGTHLPFWPLYVWCAAGSASLPSALLTVALAPAFLAVPWLSRHNGLAGRVATILVGVANTVLTIWVLGDNTGTKLFFAPCAALAAISFRRDERIIMLALTSLPLLAWYALRFHSIQCLNDYDDQVAQAILGLNVVSVSVLATAFGWSQAEAYTKMEAMPRSGFLSLGESLSPHLAPEHIQADERRSSGR